MFPFLSKAQIGEIAITGGMSFLSAENQTRRVPFGGGGTLRLSAGNNNALFSIALGYDLNQQIEHKNIQRIGMQSLKTSIGAGGYASLRNGGIFKAVAEMVYWNTFLSTQQGFIWEGNTYGAQDIKGHPLGLQVHLGLSIPFGYNNVWAFNMNTYAGGMLRRQSSYKYRAQKNNCCEGHSSQMLRRRFQNQPFSLPRAIVGFEIGLSFLIKKKDPTWTRTVTWSDPPQ